MDTKQSTSAMSLIRLQYYCQFLTYLNEERDPYEIGHSQRVGALANRLAKRLGYSSEIAAIIEASSCLHDVGKLTMDMEVLNRPGPLTEEEWKEVRLHPIKGFNIVMKLRFSDLVQGIVAPIVKYHHEHWNGSGYPEGLKGEQIPVYARLTSICDGWDAVDGGPLHLKRPYQNGNKESRFDMKSMDKLMARYEWYDPEMLKEFVKEVSGG